VDGIVVNCNYLEKHLVHDESVPQRLIHVCYNGIDLQQFQWALSPRPSSLPEDAMVIGVVCALRPEKGLATLVNAFARVRPLCKQMKLAIVGSGPMLPELQQEAREAGVFSDCIWEPATADVASWLRAFDIFVLPSLDEAFSNALMEAMACRCAVVASNVGGNPELVGHAERGLLFEARNVDALTGVLRQLIEDTALRRKVAEAGERFIRERFSRDASARRMEAIYEGLLTSHAQTR
jgi:glycosyltransferase involved in cell wall biosynthesis